MVTRPCSLHHMPHTRQNKNVMLTGTQHSRKQHFRDRFEQCVCVCVRMCVCGSEKPVRVLACMVRVLWCPVCVTVRSRRLRCG